MYQSTKFWDKIADRYSKQSIADEAAYQKKCRSRKNTFGQKWRCWKLVAAQTPPLSSMYPT